jgi:hypothetical protein
MNGMAQSMTVAGAPLLSPSFMPTVRVRTSVRLNSAAKKSFSTSQIAYRVRIYMG